MATLDKDPHQAEPSEIIHTYRKCFENAYNGDDYSYSLFLTFRKQTVVFFLFVFCFFMWEMSFFAASTRIIHPRKNTVTVKISKSVFAPKNSRTQRRKRRKAWAVSSWAPKGYCLYSCILCWQAKPSVRQWGQHYFCCRGPLPWHCPHSSTFLPSTITALVARISWPLWIKASGVKYIFKYLYVQPGTHTHITLHQK